MKYVKVAVLYYSSTGTNYQLARWAEEAASQTAEVRFRKVKELAPPEAMEGNKDWKNHLEKTQDVREVALEDLEWADVFVFSAPYTLWQYACPAKAVPRYYRRPLVQR